MDTEFREDVAAAQRHREAIAEAEAARKEAAQRRERERSEREQAQQREQIEQTLQGRWLANGGTLQEFAEQKHSLVAEYIRDLTLRGADEARELNSARYAQ